MIVRCAKLLVVIALVLTTGLHWAALQSVAWATMLASNLRTETVCEAVCNTFDGKHPCCMCKAIAAGKKSEQKKEFASRTHTLEFPPLEGARQTFAPAAYPLVPGIDLTASSAFHKPALPPPRPFFHV